MKIGHLFRLALLILGLLRLLGKAADKPIPKEDYCDKWIGDILIKCEEKEREATSGALSQWAESNSGF